MQAIGVVVSILCSIACFRRSRQFAASYGRTPWGWSPTLWAIVGFLLGIIGFGLVAFAEYRGKKGVAGQPQYGQPQYGQPQYGQPQYGQPQYGQPQYGQPQYGQPSQFGQPPQPYGQPLPPPPAGPPPGW